MRECCSGCNEVRTAVVMLAEVVRDCTPLSDCDIFEVELDELIARLRGA